MEIKIYRVQLKRCIFIKNMYYIFIKKYEYPLDVFEKYFTSRETISCFFFFFI